MITQRADLNGDEALFSDDERYRYLLTRLVEPGIPSSEDLVALEIVVLFIMLNPSTADAFKNDPTVSRCVNYARRWGRDLNGNARIILKVVNLFAMRSPYPIDLYNAKPEARGADAFNTATIIEEAEKATITITAWGTHGELDDRGLVIRDALHNAGVRPSHLGLTQGGYPKHPLARGKAAIPSTQNPIPWNMKS